MLTGSTDKFYLAAEMQQALDRCFLYKFIYYVSSLTQENYSPATHLPTTLERLHPLPQP